MHSSSAVKVKKIFSSIAQHYDRANRVITFGRDTAWRNKLVKLSGATKGSKVLDCATGTGAVVFAFLKVLGKRAKIVGLDFCPAMLEQAGQHLKRLQKKVQVKSEVSFKQADIHSIPFADNTFDVSVMAYGLRNTQKPEQVLREMARVTKKDGYVLILETGQSALFFLRPFFYFYFRFVMPVMGGLVTGQRSAYQYLQQSSMVFPSGQKFLDNMQKTGCFKELEYKTLCGGASFIYKARRF